MLIDELYGFLGRKFTHPVLALSAVLNKAILAERSRIRAYQETLRDYPNPHCWDDLAVAEKDLAKCHAFMDRISMEHHYTDAGLSSSRTMQAAIAGAYEAKQ